MPEMTSRISMRMSNGFKTLLFSLLDYYLLRIARNHTQVIDYTGNGITKQGLPPPNPDRGKPLHESSANFANESGEQALSRHLAGSLNAHRRQHRRRNVAECALLTRKAKTTPRVVDERKRNRCSGVRSMGRAVLGKHLVCVTVIGGNERHPSRSLHRGKAPAQRQHQPTRRQRPPQE